MTPPPSNMRQLRSAAAVVLREAASDLVTAHGLLAESGVRDTTGYLLDTAVTLVDFAHALSPIQEQHP